ncbi:MAG TPA: hypothetical protein VF491_17730 [Vicinamibacterales bacterium]
MAFHTIKAPLFHARDFFWASIDTINARPALYAVLLVTASIVVVKLCLAIAEIAAEREADRRRRAVDEEIAAMRLDEQRKLQAISRIPLARSFDTPKGGGQAA